MSSESVLVLGVLDFRGRSVGPTLRADFLKSLFGSLATVMLVLTTPSASGELLEFRERFSTEACLEFMRTLLGGESFDFGDTLALVSGL